MRANGDRKTQAIGVSTKEHPIGIKQENEKCAKKAETIGVR